MGDGERNEERAGAAQAGRPIPYPPSPILHPPRPVPRVYLTGFMGSGKSTVGPILANVLGVGFRDLDADVVRAAGRPIAAVFDTEGEAGFRAREAEALRATAATDGAVVATGGGALVQPRAMAWAKAHGAVVYLRVPLDALVARLARTKNVRPLLVGPDGERLSEDALRPRVAALLDAREPVYRQAHVVVEPDARGVGYTVDAVARALHRRGFF